jgi:protein required for attachment to host cells
MKLTGILAEKGFHAFDSESRMHAGHEIPRIWIVVADRVKAHIYRKSADKIELIADAEKSHKKAKADGPLKNVSHIPATHGHYLSDPRDRENHHDDREFVLELITWLAQAEQDKAFDRLVLVAAPRTLGEMRSCLNKPLSARIIAEINKELTKVPPAKIRAYLNEMVGF